MTPSRTTEELEDALLNSEPGPARDAIQFELADIQASQYASPLNVLTKHSPAEEVRAALVRYRDETRGERLDLRINATKALKSLGIPSPTRLVDAVFKDAPVIKLHRGGLNEASLKGYSQSLASCCRVLEDDGLRNIAIGPGKLRWNELRKAPEFNGKESDKGFSAKFRRRCEERIFGDDPKTGDKRIVTFSRETCEDAMLCVAQEDSYHPVKEWLESLPGSEHDTGPGAIEQVAKEALGIGADSLSMNLWRKWLLGAVARPYEPGCQLDTVLVFVAPGGGEGKSSALRMLFGSDWFSDTHLDMTGFKRDNAYMQLHRVWGYEVPELERATTPEARHRMKSFITSRSDDFRTPFDPIVRARPRMVALAATTNDLDFLPADDPAFCRRIWPMRISGEMDIGIVKSLRSAIWCEAVTAYKAGEKWHLTAEEEVELALLQARHEEFKHHDVREPLIARYVNDPRRVNMSLTLVDVIRRGLSIEPRDMSSKLQGEVKAMMESLGWVAWRRRWTAKENTTRWVKGVIRGAGRLGCRPEIPMMNPPECYDEST